MDETEIPPFKILSLAPAFTEEDLRICTWKYWRGSFIVLEACNYLITLDSFFVRKDL